MSVKLLDNEAFYGYRVRRTVNGKLYQEYFSLKKGGKRMGPKLRKLAQAEAKADGNAVTGSIGTTVRILGK